MLTTHYLEEAEELADRLAIMHQGRIVRAGTPAEVAASQPARISFKLPGDPREPAPALAGTRASVMLETADLQRTLTALLEWAKSRDLVLGALDARPTSLEQAFLAMAAPSGNRAFLGRAVRYLVGEAGVRQFLDIGTGLPAANNTHEVAQGAAPQCRVVYVDNDPVVLSHAKAPLASGPEGATAYVDADLRDPEAILAAAAEVLDFSRPVAVMLMAILQHISDQDDPYAIVARLAASVPSGSYLALSHPARDIEAAATAEIAARMNGLVAEKVYLPHPGPGTAVLRRLGAGRAGSGASTAVAARIGPGSGQPHGHVVRGRAQELTARRRAYGSALKSRAGSSPP